MTKPYAVYARQSLDREGAGLAVARQKEDCAALAARLGLPGEPVVYTDNDLSASSRRRRPGYEDLLDALRAKRHDVLVVWHNDRLNRRPIELEEFIGIAEAAALRVYAVQAGEIDLSTPSGRMVARIVGAVARQEVEHKSARRRRANEQRAMLGYRSGGTRGFGYGRTITVAGKVRDSDLLMVNSREAAAIRDAAARIIAGESTTAIWRSWNTAGLRTPRGKEWEASTFARTMTRPALAGFMVYRGNVLDGVTTKAPAILTPAELAEVQAVFAQPQRLQTRRQPVRGLVDRVATCGGCGEPLRVRLNRGRARLDGTKRQFTTYSCPAKPVPGHCFIVTHTVDRIVTATVLDTLLRIRRDPARIHADDAASHAKRMELAQVVEREQRLAEAVSDGLISRRIAARTLGNVRRDRARLTTQELQETQQRDDDPYVTAERFIRRLPLMRPKDWHARIAVENPSFAARAIRDELETEWNSLPLLVKQAVIRSTVRVVVTPAKAGTERVTVTPL